MPWKEQFRLGCRCLRWVYWPEDRHAWANAANLIAATTMMIAIFAQIWLEALAAFFLGFIISFAGRKRAL